MHADFDLDAQGNARPTSPKPPYRPGEGRPAGYSPDKAKAMQARIEKGDADLDDIDPESEEGRLATTVKKQIAQARKETALAGLNELELKIKSGQYLPRAAFREAAATMLATLSQSLRSIPDTLERKYNLQPEVLEFIEQTITEGLAETADNLALFTEQNL